jgi:hypothetical protein
MSGETNIDFTFSVGFDRAGGKVWVALDNANIHTNVPFPASIGLSAKEVNEQILAAINPAVGVHQNEVTLPNGLHLISVKVMPNGDLNVYVAPLDG